jgi:hypothetical protein
LIRKLRGLQNFSLFALPHRTRVMPVCGKNRR